MSEVPKQKIALVLSGGVSAGAYIAGALDELIAAFNASDAYTIDIIAGGSAGATTGALVAHGLLYRNGDAGLHKTWVEDVDLFRMLAKEDPPGSQITLLNGKVLEQIAADAIAWTPGEQPKAAACCDPSLILAMTIANTTALPYSTTILVPTAGDPKPFVQYRNAEQQTFRLDRSAPREQTTWEGVTHVARASSAIPFVFPRVLLNRDPENTDHFVFAPTIEKGTHSYWYYDGGTFNNLPVSLANHYIELADGPFGSGEQARVIVINPWDTSTRVKETPKNAPDLLEFGLRLISGIRNESSAVDFIKATTLPEQDDTGSGDIPFEMQPSPEVASAVEVSPDEGDPNEVIPDVDPTDFMTEALPFIPSASEALLRQTRMITPAPGAKPLRCNYLGHLSAFLDETFREYDYRRGAADARALLKSMGVERPTRENDPFFYEPDNDPRFRDVDISSYDRLAAIKSSHKEFKGRSVQSLLEDQLEQRTDYLLSRLFQEIDVPYIPDFLVEKFADMKINLRSILPHLW